MTCEWPCCCSRRGITCSLLTLNLAITMLTFQRALEVSGVLMGILVLCFYGSPVWPLVGMLYIHQAGAPPGEVLAGEGPQSHCVLG